MPQAPENKELTKGLIQIREDLDELLAEHLDQDLALPRWTWRDLETTLISLLVKTDLKASVSDHISALRKLSVWKSPQQVLREILLTSYALCDDGYQPPKPGYDEEGIEMP